MSEANSAAPASAPAAVEGAAPAAAPVLDGATSLTAGGAAPADGEGQASSAAGEGEGAQASGQETGAGEAAQGGASAEGEGASEGEGGAASGAPEQYAAFTLPEGYELPAEMLEGVTSLAKAHGMTQEQAQALVDLGVQQASAITDRFTSLASEHPVVLSQHWAQTWSKQTAEDSELGGSALASTMSLAGRVFNTFGSPELGQFLNQTGLAHHPELVRFMHKVGQAVSEDTLVLPQGGEQRGKALPADAVEKAARRMYPNMA